MPSLCRQLLAMFPRNASALHLLGRVAYQTGNAAMGIRKNVSRALELFTRAAVLESTTAHAALAGIGLAVNVAGQQHKVPRRLLKAARLGLIDLDKR